MSPNSVLQSVIQARSIPSVPQVQPSTVTTEATPIIDPVFDPDDLDAVLGVLVENAPVAMAMFDRRMRYVLANRQWINDFGLQRSLPIVGRSQFEVFPHLHPGWRNVYDRALQGHVVRSEHDVMSGPGGRTMLFRWEVRPWRKTKDAMVGGLMVTCEKFSPLETAEHESPKEVVTPTSGEQTQVASVDRLHASAFPMLVVDEFGLILHANASAITLLLAHGIEEGKSNFWDVLSDPAERGGFTKSASQALAHVLSTEGSQPIGLPFQITITPSYRWMLSRTELDNGKAGGLLLAVSVAETITAPPAPPPVPVAVLPDAALHLVQRRLEEQLSLTQNELRSMQEMEAAYRRRELRQREVLDALPCGMFVLDERGRPSFHNANTRDLFGQELRPGDSIEDWLQQACLDDNHKDEVAKLWRESVWRRQLTKVVSLSTADGLLKDFEFRPAPLPSGGLLVTIHDVTETCRLEEMLRATEAKFRALLHESPQPVVLTDQSGAIFEVNAAAEALFGLPKAELRRQRIDDWLDDESVQARRFELKRAIDAGQSSAELSVKLCLKSGKPLAAHVRIAAVYDGDARLHSTAHFVSAAPVIAATQVEPFRPTPAAQALGFAPSSPAPIAVSQPLAALKWVTLLSTNTQGRIQEWSPEATEHFGYTNAEAHGQSLHRLFRPSDSSAFFAALAQKIATPDAPFSWAWYGKAGARGEAQFTVQPCSQGGLAVRLLLESRAEPEVLAELAPHALSALPSRPWAPADLEREHLLLTETHHRIKNHLQIISSLLNLQSNALNEGDARNVLRSSQTRVLAIGELHQLLYELSAGQRPSFQDFTNDLINRLRECYGVTTEQVSATVHVEPCDILDEWLVPLALILNEAVSNAFKHAFPNGRQGHLNVQMCVDGEMALLTVSDDGIGLPPDYQNRSETSLGLKILGVFAGQMHAAVNLQPSPQEGTLFHLRFPIRCVDN